MKALLWGISGVLCGLILGNLSLFTYSEQINLGLLTALILVFCILLLLMYLFQLRNKQNEILQQKNTQIQTLHAELNHRVKNNLAYISSLMRLQGRRLRTPEAKVAIKSAANRIQAMAMIHRRLFNQRELTSIEMSEYLEELIDFLQKSYTQPGLNPLISTDLEEIQLEADPATWIGLITNELVTNAFKYAFASQEQPLIFLSLKRAEDHQLCLTIADNGPGFPLGFDWQRSESMGLSLVNTLVQQLEGKLELSEKKGVQYRILIPLPNK